MYIVLEKKIAEIQSFRRINESLFLDLLPCSSSSPFQPQASTSLGCYPLRVAWRGDCIKGFLAKLLYYKNFSRNYNVASSGGASFCDTQFLLILIICRNSPLKISSEKIKTLILFFATKTNFRDFKNKASNANIQCRVIPVAREEVCVSHRDVHI